MLVFILGVLTAVIGILLYDRNKQQNLTRILKKSDMDNDNLDLSELVRRSNDIKSKSAKE